MLNTVLIVPKLNPNTPTLMDGEVRLFKRKHSKVWQIAFTLDGRQVRVSSKKRILNEALSDKTSLRRAGRLYRYLSQHDLLDASQILRQIVSVEQGVSALCEL